jgi:thymidylate kinase
MSARNQYKELLNVLAGLEDLGEDCNEPDRLNSIKQDYASYKASVNPDEKILYSSPQEYAEYRERKRQEEIEKRRKEDEERKKKQEEERQAWMKAKAEQVKRDYEQIFGKPQPEEVKKKVELTVHEPVGKRLIKLE